MCCFRLGPRALRATVAPTFQAKLKLHMPALKTVVVEQQSKPNSPVARLGSPTSTTSINNIRISVGSSGGMGGVHLMAGDSGLEGRGSNGAAPIGIDHRGSRGDNLMEEEVGAEAASNEVRHAASNEAATHGH